MGPTEFNLYGINGIAHVKVDLVTIVMPTREWPLDILNKMMGVEKVEWKQPNFFTERLQQHILLTAMRIVNLIGLAHLYKFVYIFFM